MKKSNLLACLLVAFTALGVATGCEKTDTASVVAKASKMSLEQLKEASRKEMEASDDTFKVLGLTSTLAKAATAIAKEYDWLRAEDVKKSDGTVLKANIYVNNGYKDYTLLSALEQASETYVADYALTQDERSISDYVAAGILHNYVPSDWAELGLTEETCVPLRGIHFSKIFWTNKNFETVTGKKLYNIWQLAGTDADADHLAKVSFQSPTTEQINMSFLLSCYAPENQARIAKAYKDYYKKDWVATGDFDVIGKQWVSEFIANVSRWHSSDGTAMKETQLKDDWNEGVVYYGAFAKMKDAAGKSYAVAGQDQDPILAPLVVDGKVNAMKTVKWDWEINGFNGFMYTMDSQIVNNAKHPYTACLYARYLLTPEMYKSMCFRSETPNKAGENANMYGYYYPCNNGKVADNDNDWTKAKWFEVSIVEDYEFLGSVKSSHVNNILAMCSSNKKAK